jgi:hypothetical protein
MRKLRPYAISVCVLAIWTADAHADEPTKQQCSDADTNAQTLRSTGKFSAARDALKICSSGSCPQVVQRDCIERLDELDRAEPSVVLAAQDDAGNDLSAVKVTVDGKPFADSLDGPAIAIDPGAHDFKFETAGKAAVTRHVVIHEGEKGRREAVVFKGGTTPPAATSTTVPASNSLTPPPAEPNPSSGLGTQKIIGIAVAGVGVVGVAIGAIFGVSASSAWSSSQSECASATSCTNHAQAISDHDSAVSKGTISTIGFIGGGVLVAGGAVLFLTAPKSPSSPTVGIAPSLNGAFVRGTF